MKNKILYFVALLLAVAGVALPLDHVESQSLPAYKNPELPIQARVDDLLSRLVSAQDDDGTRMTESQLRDEAMTLYLAGHETTALTLTWSWYLIASHSEVEAKLIEEWSRVLDGRSPTPEELARWSSFPG